MPLILNLQKENVDDIRLIRKENIDIRFTKRMTVLTIKDFKKNFIPYILRLTERFYLMKFNVFMIIVFSFLVFMIDNLINFISC